MAKKKTFRVYAKVITYCYIDIDAKTKEEAEDIAMDTDGGDFVNQDESGGDFIVVPEGKPTEEV
jgi:hypothetical protein